MKIQLGEKTTKNISKISTINGWQNRTVYGVSALLAQPFFDYKNPSVDKETRKYSLTKTLIKIIVGTSVGLLSRVPFQKLGENLYEKGLFKSENFALEKIDKARFKSCVGNVFSIIGAVLAMFSIDIIISNFLMSYFNKKIQGKSIKK